MACTLNAIFGAWEASFLEKVIGLAAAKDEAGA